MVGELDQWDVGHSILVGHWVTAETEPPASWGSDTTAHVSEGGDLELYSGLRAGTLLQWGFRWAWCVENELGVLGLASENFFSFM
jgi:hypothetical protein